MEFVLKKLVFLFMFVMINVSFSISYYSFGETSDDKGGSSDPTAGYNVAYITCDAIGCQLNCYGGGPAQCNFADADDACGCDFTASNSQDMFDHAHAQMDANILTGTYVNNIIPQSGTKYYRSVSWTEDSNGIRVIDYTLGVD